MVGISIFPGMELSLDESLEYLEKGKKAGVELVFTSMHIPEANQSRVESELEAIMKKCEELNMKVIIDISKKYYEKYSWDFKNLYALRLDFGFTSEEIIEISQKYPIQLNASTVDLEWFNVLERKGLVKDRITVCHNYYPRKDTGISLELLRERNELYKSMGFKTMAFVQGDGKKRGPLYEGLSTCESHRDLDILVASQELMFNLTDIVIIGDSMGTDEEIKKLGKLKKDTVILPAIFEELSEAESKIIFSNHRNRLDNAENVIRSDRQYNKYKLEVKPFNNIERKIGSITLDNSEYLRYEGELQIVLKNLQGDKRVNVVGRILFPERLLKLVKAGVKFEFFKVK